MVAGITVSLLVYVPLALSTPCPPPGCFTHDTDDVELIQKIIDVESSLQLDQGTSMAMGLSRCFSLPDTHDGKCTPAADDTDKLSLLQGKLRGSHQLAPFPNRARALPSTLGNLRSADQLMSEAYYINLDRSPDRKKYAEEHLLRLQSASEDKYGHFNFHRVPGRDAKLDQEIKLIIQNPEGNARWANTPNESRPGLLANCLSHLRAWKFAWQDVQRQPKHAKFVLIMEDDVKFLGSSLESLPSRLASLPLDADIVSLGSFGLKRPSDYIGNGMYDANGAYFVNKTSKEDVAVWLQESKRRNKTNGFGFFYGGLHAYLIRADRLPALISWMETRATSYLCEALTVEYPKECRKYVLDPPIAWQNHGLHGFPSLTKSLSA